MTEALAARRGIADRSSGAAVVDAARRAMRDHIAQTMPADAQFNQTNVTMLGLVTRLQAFHEAAAREIVADNPFSSATLLRSLSEVVALICYLIAKPDDLRRVAMGADNRDRFNIGKLLQAAGREAPGFEGIYAQLSNLAHPSYAGANTSMSMTQEGRFSWRSRPSFKDESEAFLMYLWLLELTEAAGLLWCKLNEKVSPHPVM